jgi:hypothetical protein
MLSRILLAWCRIWHDDPCWPIRGSYECRSCQRKHPVRWANAAR